MLWPYGPGYLYAACWDVDPLKWKTGFSPPVQSILLISFYQYQYQYYKQKKKEFLGSRRNCRINLININWSHIIILY